MATNKVIDKFRAENSQRNLVERKAQGQLHQNEYQAEAAPVDRIEFQEILEKAKARLSENELAIANLRGNGATWLDISREMGESPQALRKRLERACARIAEEFGIE